jgi:uncharacterized membrane protein YkvA (DUF1232 family)
MARQAQPRNQAQAKAKRGRNKRVGLRRLVGLAAFLPLASRAPMYARLFWELVRDERTPAGRKALLGAALGYVALGRDLIPDDVPIIGGIDDIVVVILAVDVFLDGVPDDVLDEKLEDLGIDVRAFHEDVARIRRFTPGPLRRIIRRAPAAISMAGQQLEKAGVGPKVRNWINREESIA